MVLHAYLQSDMVLTIFNILLGKSYSTAYNSKSNYDRNKMFAVLNSQVFISSKHGRLNLYTKYRACQIKL